jgi:hypothetical protein
MVAYHALFVALGGTAFAGPIAQLAKTVSGDSVVKKRTLSGNRLRKDTVTGTEVKENTLGQVPKANQANNAGSANSAGFANSANSSNTANAANSANTAQTANSAQTAQSVVPNAIGSAQVIDDSLTGQDINESTLSGVGGLLTGRIKSATTNATTFGAPSGESTAGANRGPVQMNQPFTSGFAAHGLRVSLPAGLGSGQSVQVTLFDGASATGLTCTVANLGSICGDTQHTASLTGSTALSIQVISSGGAITQDVVFGFAVQGG